jgi:hypothetical protein
LAVHVHAWSGNHGGLPLSLVEFQRVLAVRSCLGRVGCSGCAASRGSLRNNQFYFWLLQPKINKNYLRTTKNTNLVVQIDFWLFILNFWLFIIIFGCSFLFFGCSFLFLVVLNKIFF